MKHSMWAALGALWIGAALGQVPIVGGEGNTLQDLVKKSTPVTIVFVSGSKDINLRISDVGPDFVTVVTPKGESLPYQVKDIKEIRVQSGDLVVKEVPLVAGVGLTKEHLLIVRRALERSGEIFAKGDTNQNIKIQAAALFTQSSEVPLRKKGVEYLTQLLKSNDVPLTVTAGLSLYLGGEPADTIAPILPNGLASGDRKTKGRAANLCGLVDDKSSTDTLEKLLMDSAEEVCAPAARALARLGDREVIPTLFEMLSHQNNVKAEAATLALARLGGAGVIKQLQDMLPKSEGVMRFRVAVALFLLNVPEGRIILENDVMEMPMQAREAAIALAPTNSMKAIRLLRDQISRPLESTPAAVDYRARVATALFKSGDRSAISTLQDLLRDTKPDLVPQVCAAIAMLGARSNMAIMQASIESADPALVLAACRAVMAMAYPEFQKRLIEISDNAGFRVR